MAMPRKGIKFSSQQRPEGDCNRQADIDRESVKHPAELVEPEKLVGLVFVRAVDLAGPASRRQKLVVGLFVAEVDFGRGRRRIVARVD